MPFNILSKGLNLIDDFTDSTRNLNRAINSESTKEFNAGKKELKEITSVKESYFKRNTRIRKSTPSTLEFNAEIKGGRIAFADTNVRVTKIKKLINVKRGNTVYKRKQTIHRINYTLFKKRVKIDKTLFQPNKLIYKRVDNIAGATRISRNDNRRGVVAFAGHLNDYTTVKLRGDLYTNVYREWVRLDRLGIK